jgi:hypothetical protein
MPREISDSVGPVPSPGAFFNSLFAREVGQKLSKAKLIKRTGGRSILGWRWE